MEKQELVFGRLTDVRQLEEVHILTHDSFVEGGLISPTPDGKLDIYSHLDSLQETLIVTATLAGQLVATCSITKDNKHGLQSDKFFKEETDHLREKHRNLGCSWRIVTAPPFRRDIRLIKRLIDHTALAAQDLGIEYCLYCFATKHENIYSRLIGAKTITRKVIHYQENREGNEFALMISRIAEYEPFYVRQP